MTNSSISFSKPVTFVTCTPSSGGWYVVCDAAIRGLREEGLVSAGLVLEERALGTAMPLLEEMATALKGDASTLAACSPDTALRMLHEESPHSYEDVTPIAAIGAEYGVLVVPQNSSLKSLGDLLELLKKELHSAPMGGLPSGFHRAIVATVAYAAGLDPANVNYTVVRGLEAVVASLHGGQIVASALGTANAEGEIRKGTVRAIAVLSEERQPGVYKDVPTTIEQELDVTFPIWRGFYAAAGLSAEAREFWVNAFASLAGTETWARILDELGWVPYLLTGKQFEEFLKEERQRYIITCA